METNLSWRHEVKVRGADGERLANPRARVVEKEKQSEVAGTEQGRSYPYVFSGPAPRGWLPLGC